jgi:succinate dehydrogenase / fumarate reductase cytochrome b subunit
MVTKKMTKKGYMISISSGKKSIMAFTGLFFCFFLCSHLAGNFFIFSGREGFNSYAGKLHSLGPLITVIELILFFLLVVHIITGVILFWENYSARPVKYSVRKKGEGATLGSLTMPWTGLIILCFLMLHLSGFFLNGEITSVYDTVKNILTDNLVAGLYLFAVVCVGLHVSHGLWSAFQTLGIGSEKYTGSIRTAGYVASIILGAGFGLIPVYFILYF